MKDILDIKKIRKDMMELWKKTFHDSNRYIQIVFDTYFSPDNAFTVYDGDKLIAALLGVEYDFQESDEKGECKYFKGMYLCGLATDPEYRRQGIMSKLIDSVESVAKARGCRISFLIPADDHLRNYYGKMGYRTVSFKRRKRIKYFKKDDLDKMYIYTLTEMRRRKNFSFIDEIASWCSDIEKQDKSCVSILHSKKDMIAIMSENENSFFITDDTFDPEYPILAKVRAVVFPIIADDDSGSLRIVGLYVSDKEGWISRKMENKCMQEFIMNALHQIFPKYEVELDLPFTGRELIRENGIIPYALVKNIGERAKFHNSEVRPFKISLMLD